MYFRAHTRTNQHIEEKQVKESDYTERVSCIHLTYAVTVVLLKKRGQRATSLQGHHQVRQLIHLTSVFNTIPPIQERL